MKTDGEYMSFDALPSQRRRIAIVGGGIGLLLTQAIQTTMDWEKVTYYIILIVLMVIAMDALSGWLRKKLIKGDTGR